jgi:hypothetical protein
MPSRVWTCLLASLAAVALVRADDHLMVQEVDAGVAEQLCRHRGRGRVLAVVVPEQGAGIAEVHRPRDVARSVGVGVARVPDDGAALRGLLDGCSVDDQRLGTGRVQAEGQEGAGAEPADVEGHVLSAEEPRKGRGGLRIRHRLPTGDALPGGGRGRC